MKKIIKYLLLSLLCLLLSSCIRLPEIDPNEIGIKNLGVYLLLKQNICSEPLIFAATSQESIFDEYCYKGKKWHRTESNKDLEEYFSLDEDLENFTLFSFSANYPRSRKNLECDFTLYLSDENSKNDYVPDDVYRTKLQIPYLELGGPHYVPVEFVNILNPEKKIAAKFCYSLSTYL